MAIKYLHSFHIELEVYTKRTCALNQSIHSIETLQRHFTATVSKKHNKFMAAEIDQNYNRAITNHWIKHKPHYMNNDEIDMNVSSDSEKGSVTTANSSRSGQNSPRNMTFNLNSFGCDEVEPQENNLCDAKNALMYQLSYNSTYTPPASIMLDNKEEISESSRCDIEHRMGVYCSSASSLKRRRNSEFQSLDSYLKSLTDELEEIRRTLGPTHIRVAEVATTLGLYYSHCKIGGEEGLTYYQHALEVLEQQDKSTHQDIHRRMAETWIDIANAYIGMKMYYKAVEAFNECISLFVTYCKLSENNPKVANVRRQREVVMRRQV